MKLLHLFRRGPLPGSPSTENRRIPHWLRRSGVGVLALSLAGFVGFADLVVAQEISVEAPAGTLAGGSVVVWGYNYNGEANVPAGLKGAQSVVGGGQHSVALLSDGTVVAWGVNGAGQTNVPAGLTGVKAIAAGSAHTAALKSDGTVVAWGFNNNGETDVPAGLTDVQSIASGASHTIALKGDGTVVAWGRNDRGQLNVPAGLTGVQAIAAGGFHSLALLSDTTVVAWGNSDFGITSVPAGLSDVQAIAAGYYHNMALKADGTVIAWGYSQLGSTNVPAGLTGVQAIGAGYYHNLALKTDGAVVAWGNNGTAPSTVPAGLTGVQAIAAGTFHSYALANPLVVTLANQRVGSTSAAQTFTIKNTGGAALNVSGVTLVGGDAGDFTLSTTGMLTSVPAITGETTFTVTFTPGNAGLRQTTLRVLSDDADEGTYDIALAGTGFVAPEISIEQPAGTPLVNPEATFADQNVASASAAKSFTIKNTGNATLHVTNLSVTGTDAADFVVDASEFPDTLDAATGETTFTVTFTPGGAGERNATLNIASDDADEGSYAIALSGIGVVVPEISVFDGESTQAIDERADNSDSATFANTVTDGSGSSRIFTIKNTGTGVLSDLVVTTTNSEEFSVTDLASTTLAPDETATFTVTFTPGSTTARSAMITIASDDADENPFRIAVTGTGVLAAALPDFAFIGGKRGAIIDVLGNDPGLNPANTTITFPTAPQHGTVTVVNGKVRYLPTGVLPLGGDTFTYRYDDGQGGTGEGTVTITNLAAIAGEYDGLIEATFPRITVLTTEIDGASRHRQSGHLRMSFSRTGAFTGVLTFAGTRLNQIGQSSAGAYAFMGVLDSAGKIVRTIQRRGLPPIEFVLQFDGNTGRINGTASSTDGSAQFTSELSLAKRTAFGPTAHVYSIQIIPEDAPGTPAGNGTANVRIGPSGNVIITGTLPDGAPFSTVGFLHADQSFPLYSILYNGSATTRGSLRGNVQLPGNDVGRVPLLRGLEWFKPARPLDALFPEGFTMNAYEQFETLLK